MKASERTAIRTSPFTKPIMRLGISSYTFGWAVGVRGFPPASPLAEQGLLAKTKELGVNLLQIGDNLPLHEFSSSRLARLSAAAADLGVQLEIGARGLTPERIKQYAGLTRQLGASLLRFVVDQGDYQPSPETVTGILRQCASQLQGLTLALENHDRFPAALLRQMIEEAGENRIGVCLDTANSLGAGEGIESVAAILAPLTVNLHIKDFWIERVPYQMGFHVTGRPAGSGLVNVPALIAQLAPYQRCRSAVLELWTPPEGEVEATIRKEAAWARQSIDYLRPLFDP